MHRSYDIASGITGDVIGAAIDVHKEMGPGLLESVYEWCLTKELELRGFNVQSQGAVVVRYRQFERQESLKFDLMICSSQHLI